MTPPTVLAPAQPAPAPAPAAPDAPASPGQSRTTIAPGVVEQAEQEARERTTTRRAERPARPAPVRERTVARAAPAVAAPAVSSAPPASAATAETEAPATPPAAAPPPATIATEQPAAPVVASTTAPAERSRGSSWLLLAGLGLVAAAIAAFFLLRRRREDEVHEAYYEPEPVADAAPLSVTPDREPVMLDPVAASPSFIDEPAIQQPRHEPEVHAALEHATLTTPDRDDIDAVLGGAAPQGERPQLELAMRPIRAGINRDEGVVEFELTVANAGGVQAEDVRIGAFMLSGRGEGDTDIERLLVNPPADAIIAADTIAPGDGTRLDAAVTLPRDELWVADDGAGHDGFTPVVLADARYRLPDGSEGRTAAAFTIGRVNGGDALIPIALDDEPTMYADIEARLHSVAAKL